MLHPGGAPFAKIHFTLYDLPNADFFRGCADFFEIYPCASKKASSHRDDAFLKGAVMIL